MLYLVGNKTDCYTPLPLFPGFKACLILGISEDVFFTPSGLVCVDSIITDASSPSLPTYLESGL